MGWKTNKKTQQKPIKAIPRVKTSGKQTFLEHIYELRARLFWVVATLLLASSLAFAFKDLLVGFILAPLQGEKLVYLTVGGGFSFIFTICLYFGVVMTIPVIVYHLYRFLQPLLVKASRRLTASVVLASAVLALAGAAFGYFVAIRASINFLMGFAQDAISASVTADSYLNFIIAYTAGLALIFQLPLVMFIFDHIRPFPPGSLLSSQRFVITGAMIIAALITPTPDAVNMMIIAVPIIAIYEVGALIVVLRHRLRRTAADKRAEVDLPVVKEELKNPHPVIAAAVPTTISPVPAVPIVQRRQMGRSIDGVMSVAVQPRQAIIIPSRSAPIHRTVRGISIDGVSIIGA